MKKMISWILTAALLLGLVPLSVFASKGTTSANEADLAALVEQQVRSFAATLARKESVDNAASALAKHGISGGGKTLKAGKSHALTATLWSSELLQQVVIDGCVGALQAMHQTDLATLSDVYGTIGWYENNMNYFLYKHAASSKDWENWDWEICYIHSYKGKINDYDRGLFWLAGSTATFMEIQRTNVTQSEATYRVTFTVSDSFDFNSVSAAGFTGLVSGLAALLFRAFDWESTVSFDLTVPYFCTHSSGAYRWSYDPDSATLSSLSDETFTENAVTRHPYVRKDGSTEYYYELAETVRLYHDKPWVIEYEAEKVSRILFAPFGTTLSVTQPTLTVYAKSMHFRFMDYYWDANIQRVAQDLYGLYYPDSLLEIGSVRCTYRLENRLAADGSNCIYLNVRETETGRILVDDEPLDNRYRRELTTGLVSPVDDSDNGMCGLDFYINFIGHGEGGVLFDAFDLRIWENGQNSGSGTYFTDWTTAETPDCATPGKETRQCAICGFRETKTIPATGHTPGKEATCTENQICTVCNAVLKEAKGHSETDIPAREATCENAGSTAGKACGICKEILEVSTEIPALGHQYYAGTCTRCRAADPDFLPGDANGDGNLDYNDALLILRASIGLEALSEETVAACDLNGNGKPDYADALAILRTSIGL